MSNTTEVKVPDIGDFADVPVIEVLVSEGDRVDAEQGLVTLESDKATMDVPSPYAGKVAKLRVSAGDTVSEGTPLLDLETVGEGSGEEHSDGPGETAEPEAEPAPEEDERSDGDAHRVTDRSEENRDASGGGEVIEVTVPDIGDFSDVPVIEVLVAAGDRVEAEQGLVTLESDKATMDVPAPRAGVVRSVKVEAGDRVSEGTPLLDLEPSGAGEGTVPAKESREAAREVAESGDAPSRRDEARAEEPPARSPARDETTFEAAEAARPEDQPPSAPPGTPLPDPRAPAGRPSPTATLAEEEGRARPLSHATPAVRRFARELGVDVSRVKGTGRKGRILKDDVKHFVKEALAAPAAAVPGAGIEPVPEVDFSKFGEVETRPLSRIKTISGPHLRRSWLNVPHVTHHDEADVTELERFRTALKPEAEKQGVRVTALAFIMKAVVAALREHPSVNASLTPDGKSLVYKKYFHIGIAVDTPNGLVVPVFRDVDRKGIFDLAQEMADVSARARDGKLKPDEMKGGCISISSLGGIGGTGFTPIVNAPEVAILGVSRARMQPVWNGSDFEPRLMLPLDLSYDHRVIDGAEAARFVAFLCRVLGDLRRLLL